MSWLECGKLKYEEIYRFKNGLHEKNGFLCWDLEYLFNEIKNGLKKCKKINKIPVSIAIDTWGVDFVLLNKKDIIIGETVSYRDGRTNGIPEEVFKNIPENELYKNTGVQKQQYNTIFQLFAIKKNNPEYIEQAEAFLMIPDYFNYLLTGVKVNEYTNATTTGLLNLKNKKWDSDVIKRLGLKCSMFGEIKSAGTKLGSFINEIAVELGFNSEVILAPSHDTASAILAAPYADTAIYISSGTWSLMGIENDVPLLGDSSRLHDFTNEGGYGYKYCFLKNIMGLWIIQSVKKEFSEKGTEYSFSDLSNAAIKNADFPSRINVTDSCFLSPESMINAVKGFCLDTRQKEPQSIGEICSVIYHSLADCYAKTASEIELLANKRYDTINIVGGGCQDIYLNKLTAEKSGKKVIAGPVEATALGNILTQMITLGEVENISEARELIKKSFELNADMF